MRERVYVDRLFADYEDTPEIKDFKEEISANLKERIKELASKGLDEEKAFDTATAELGDITAIADDIGKKKRQEAIGQMYMGAKVPITKRTAAGMAAATALLLLAVGIALIALFGVQDRVWQTFLFSAPLLSLACSAYAYFGLTQETRAHYAMKSGRALGYGFVCLAGLSGASFAAVMLIFSNFSVSAALGIMMGLMLPAICALVFLLATEKKRQKPWLKAMMEHYEKKIGLDLENSINKHYTGIVNPIKAARFGIASGGLWIIAIALFFSLLLAIGWPYAWLVFIFALALQVFMASTIFEKK